MATTYKNQQVGVETLTARVFADGVDIHPSHRLRNCTTFEWFHDFLDGMAPVSVGTNQNYDVDLNDINNSGEYYCEINIGSEFRISDRRRISIVRCDSTASSPATLPFEGGQAQVSVEHAHFETPVFSAEGLDWITLQATPPQCAVADAVCLTPATFNVAAQTGPNMARRGQVSLTIGELVCYFNVVQDFDQGANGAGTEDDPALGPTAFLTQDGPAEAGGIITVTANTEIVGGMLDPNDALVTFAGTGRAFLPTQLQDSAGNPTNVWTEQYSSATPAVITASATLSSRTDSFPSISDSIQITFGAAVAPQPAVLLGDLSGAVDCDGFMSRVGSFRVSSGNSFDIIILHEPDGPIGPTLTSSGNSFGAFFLGGPGTVELIEPRNIASTVAPSAQTFGLTGYEMAGASGQAPITQILRVTGTGVYQWRLHAGPVATTGGNPLIRDCNRFTGNAVSRTSFSIR